MADELKLVWIDMEMTGLDPEADAVLEIACIITGPDLQPVAETAAVIHQPPEVLARMSEFVRDMHTRNGLLDRVRASATSLREAEQQVLALVRRHCAARQGVLAGNSIHQDRRFMIRHMPELEAYLHYRQVDVSSLKVLVQAWYPALPKFEKADKDHTALADIRQSLAELTYYRANALK